MLRTRTLRRILIAGAALIGLATIQSSSAAATDGPLDPISYRIRTVFTPPSGPDVENTIETYLLVPTPVDVDGDTVPDAIAQVQIDAARVTLRVTKLPSAPSPMPVLFEAILADPRQGSPLAVAFGFDSRADDTPGVFQCALLLGGTTQVTSFSLDLETADAGSTLGIVAEVFDEGPAGQRNDPQRGRLDVTPVPTVSHFGGLAGSDLGISQSTVDFTTNIETKAVILLETASGATSFRLDATLDKVPNAVTLHLNESGEANRTLDYTATSRIQDIVVSAVSTENGDIVDELLIGLQDMSLSATLLQDSPTHVSFFAESPIGVVDVASASGGRVKQLEENNSYLFADDSGGIDSLAVRVLGLSAFDLSTGDPFVIDATLAAGPFHVLADLGDTHVEGWIRDLPSSVHLEISTTSGTVAYQGSAPVGELTVLASDPDGLIGRATSLDLLMRDIPTQLGLSFDQTGNTVSLDAGGQVLGLLEVLVTDGPQTRLPAEVDGILLQDLADRYVLFGRVTGLKHVEVTSGPPPDLLLSTVPGRVFQLDLNQLDEGKVVFVRGTIDHLTGEVRIRLEDQGDANRVTYTASAPTNSLVFDTNSGDRQNMHAEISGPLPASLDICAASSGQCTDASLVYRQRPRTPNAGSIAVFASEHTTINLFDCVRPLNANCTSSPTDYTRITNWRVRNFQMDAGATSIGDAGYIWENTSDYTGAGCSGPPAPQACRYPVSGSIIVRDTSAGTGLEQVFGPNFWTDNRTGRWSIFGLSKTKTGQINCSASSLSVWVLNLKIGVSSFLC